MLRAGALLYAIFVTLIVSLLTMSILWGHYFGTIQIQNSIKRTQLENNIRSAINMALVSPQSLPYNQETSISPFADDQSVVLEKLHWGMYDLIKGKTSFKTDTISQQAFVGQNIFDADSVALYVADREKEVYISGGILIKGICKVPDATFKHAYINSNNASSKQIYPNKLDKSSSALPELDEFVLAHNINILSNPISFPLQVDLFDFLANKDSVSVSFLEPTLVLRSDKACTLRNINLSGNLMIVSSQVVVIESTAHLNNVLVYAPEIRLDDEVKGTMQLFATDSIIVGEACRLFYPSCIATFSATVSNIKLSKDAKIMGNIIQFQTGQNESNSHINIEQGAQVQGVVYSNGLIQQRGSVYGSMYTNQLYLKTAGGYYENYLADTEIDFSKLPKSYVSCNLFKQKKQRVLSWLY